MIMNKVFKSLRNINWRLFAALLVLGLCPAVYTTVRTFFLGQLPGEWSYSIAGQLSWVNLIYEIVNEAIILPLFFFIGKVISDKKEFTNRVKTGLLISLGVYAILSAVILIFAEPLLSAMAASPDIIKESATYIRIEGIANIFGILFSFVSVALISLGKDRFVYILTGIKLVLCIISDTFLVSTLPVSLNLGVNGIGVSNIIVNALLFASAVILLAGQGCHVFSKGKLSFAWAKDFAKIGGISGLESFVRNIAYMLMVSRMVNMVGEQGTYWVANNFIWGWMLLPITQLGELIKQETATDEKAVNNNSLGYFSVTAIVCALWAVLIPTYKPFMQYVLGYADVDKLFRLVMVLFAFYILYAFQNVFDCTFYGRGKTNYMLFESVVTNSVYGTGIVSVVSNVTNDEQLGEFVIENELQDEIALVPEGASHLLDKEKIGRIQRAADGGVYVGNLYVCADHFEMPKVYDGISLPKVEPEPWFAFRLLVAEPPQGDESNEEAAEWISLPMTLKAMREFATRHNVDSITDCVYYGFESSIPQITSDCLPSMDDIKTLNDIAKRMAEMSPEDQVKFKAALVAERPYGLTLADMDNIAANLDKYEMTTVSDNAGAFFKEYLLHHLDTRFDPEWLDTLVSFREGNKLLERLGACVTDYGIISASGRTLFQLLPYDQEQTGKEEIPAEAPNEDEGMVMQM